MGFKVKYQWNKVKYTIKTLQYDNATVSSLLTEIYKETFNGVRSTALILTYNGKELSTMSSKLSTYGMGSAKNRIQVAIANNGGTSTCKFPSDVSTKSTTCSFYYMTYQCAQIECGCYMSNEGILAFIKSASTRSEFLKCPRCKKVLNSLENIFYLANYDDDDLEDKLYDLLSKTYRLLNKDENSLDLSECPNCDTMNKRPKSLKEYRISCGVCHNDYCYECENTWKKSGFQLCGNKNCETWEIQQDLTNCPPLPYENRYDWVRTFNDKYAKGNKKDMIPSIRACPGCLNLLCVINACQHITCNSCKHEFCYVCLGNWKTHNSTKCLNTKPHARQTLN